MSMKKFVFVSLMMACLPFLAMAQTNDDLYFIPKKKTEKKAVGGVPAKVVIEKEQAPTTVYASPGSTIVVKDAEGNLTHAEFTLPDADAPMAYKYIRMTVIDKEGKHAWTNPIFLTE